MNEITNKFLLSGDKFIEEIHLKQPGFTYIACRPFNRKKQIITKSLKKQEIQYRFLKINQIKLVLAHDMAY